MSGRMSGPSGLKEIELMWPPCMGPMLFDIALVISLYEPQLQSELQESMSNAIIDWSNRRPLNSLKVKALTEVSCTTYTSVRLKVFAIVL